MDLLGMRNYLASTVIPMGRAHTAFDVVTDMLLSLVFFYKLAEGMSLDMQEIASLVTSPKFLKLLIGWILGIVFVATGEIPLNFVFQAWQLSTFATFSFEEVKSIVRRFSMAKGASPQNATQHGPGSDGGRGSIMKSAAMRDDSQA
ncbi:hypothetical protein HDV00_007266 [Rhizophlyctis rosea]|nr:hypothetical protein HDV00_007266 [Rhizophlyctis rosea]